MKTIYLAIVLLLSGFLSDIIGQELYKLKLDNNNGYAYSLVEQKNFIKNNKQHLAIKYGDDHIKPEYYGQCFDYIQNILSRQTNWPLSLQDEMSLNIFVNNQGQIICVTIYTFEDIVMSDAKAKLVSFFVEVSKWNKSFVPAISDDNSKIYGWQWASGAFEFPVAQ